MPCGFLPYVYHSTGRKRLWKVRMTRQVSAVLNHKQPLPNQFQFQVIYKDSPGQPKVWEPIETLIMQQDYDHFMPMLEDYFRDRKKKRSELQSRRARSKIESAHKKHASRKVPRPQKRQKITSSSVKQSSKGKRKPAPVAPDPPVTHSKSQKKEKTRVTFEVVCKEPAVSKKYLMADSGTMARMMSHFGTVIADLGYSDAIVTYSFKGRTIGPKDAPAGLGMMCEGCTVTAYATMPSTDDTPGFVAGS
eukprot:g22107.t1